MKKIDIEKLLQWALREELPKGRHKLPRAAATYRAARRNAFRESIGIRRWRNAVRPQWPERYS